MIDRATKSGDLFDYTTTQETVLVRGGEKNSFYLIVKGFVGVGHLQLHLEV